MGEEGLVGLEAGGLVAEGGVGEEELGLVAGCQRGANVEFVLKEEVHGEESGLTVVGDAGEGFGVGLVDDDGGEFGVGVGEGYGERGSEAEAVGDNGGGGNVAGVYEVIEGGGGVFGHAGFGGVRALGLAVASVVDSEDVYVGSVE